MIILITGRPGVGKSTLIQKVIDGYAGPAFWVVTAEIRDAQGARVGFRAENSSKQTETISHKTDIQSTAIIGQNAVDLDAIDKMFGRVLQEASNTKRLILIDEIGPIQLLSNTFANALADTFNRASQTDMIATIHYSDPRLEAYRSSKEAWLFTANLTNRDVLGQLIILCAQHMEMINKLSRAQQRQAYALLEKYLEQTALTQIEKLLDNAIYYAVNGAVVKLNSNTWEVTGKHGVYTVHKHGSEYACTCDLFNGWGKYAAHAGECSHIQAVYL